MKRLSLPIVTLCLLVWSCGDDSDDGSGGNPPDDGMLEDAASMEDSSTGEDAAAKGDCKPPKEHEPGETTVNLTSGGIDRSYLLYVPAGYNPRRKIAVVLDFHGTGSNPAQEVAISEMRAAADAENFVIVAPAAAVPVPGTDPPQLTWNVPVDPAIEVDDVQFTSDVIADVSDTLCVDRQRIFATGFSGGGRLTSLLACNLSDEIAAVGTVGGLRFTDPCPQERRVPIISFHGTADQINPYDGGPNSPPYWVGGVEEALGSWGEALECEGKVTTEEVSENVDTLGYESCSDLVLYRVTDGGHTWPGTAFPFPPDPFGTVTQEIDATELQWAFFEEHPLKK
jgi:polyhydroxybutyrate depolymerase